MFVGVGVSVLVGGVVVLAGILGNVVGVVEVIVGVYGGIGCMEESYCCNV